MGGICFLGQLRSLTASGKEWNLSTLGDLRRKKLTIVEKLRIQSSEEGVLTRENKEERLSMNGEFETILIREDMSLGQKAKVNCVKEGDKNTFFFRACFVCLSFIQ